MNWRNSIIIFKDRLRNIYQDNFKRLVLYGSAARGELEDGSDIDLLVVLENYEDFWEEFHKINEIAYKVSLENDFEILISAFPVTLNKYRHIKAPLLLNVREEGITV
jgi:predicted nucleotidyltransferase